MKNLVYQYYIPYEESDADMGGFQMPEWAKAGSRSAKAYADACGADYILSHDRYFTHLDPRLDSTRIFYDPFFEQYDRILCLDLDMLVATKDNIFKTPSSDISMVHEVGVHRSQGGWMRNVMDVSLSERGIIAYGKHLFGKNWMFPKSTRYPDERFRYLNGGLQLWSKEGRAKAREHFTSIDDYVLHTRYTEQMYINLQISQPVFEVRELDTYWNRLPYQWFMSKPDGKINHFFARFKFEMPKLERTELSIWQPT
jgi:hypothetical protein